MEGLSWVLIPGAAGSQWDEAEDAASGGVHHALHQHRPRRRALCASGAGATGAGRRMGDIWGRTVRRSQTGSGSRTDLGRSGRKRPRSGHVVCHEPGREKEPMGNASSIEGNCHLQDGTPAWTSCGGKRAILARYPVLRNSSHGRLPQQERMRCLPEVPDPSCRSRCDSTGARRGNRLTSGSSTYSCWESGGCAPADPPAACDSQPLAKHAWAKWCPQTHPNVSLRRCFTGDALEVARRCFPSSGRAGRQKTP